VRIGDVESSDRGEKKVVEYECCCYGKDGRFNKSPEARDHKHKQQVYKARRGGIDVKSRVCRERERGQNKN